jgi:Zn finger protein HypA/HybF involved in hydrogenase expression
MNKKSKNHIEARLICPECSAVVITPRPEVLIWERCPGCGSHVWDSDDLLMAEIVPVSDQRGRTLIRHGLSEGRN